MILYVFFNLFFLFWSFYLVIEFFSFFFMLCMPFFFIVEKWWEWMVVLYGEQHPAKVLGLTSPIHDSWNPVGYNCTFLKSVSKKIKSNLYWGPTKQKFVIFVRFNHQFLCSTAQFSLCISTCLHNLMWMLSMMCSVSLLRPHYTILNCTPVNKKQRGNEKEK